MTNQWIITKDIICDGESVGVTSPSFDKAVEMPVKFRLYDDDDNLYLEGEMEDHDFDPLDDFGMPSYGCTTLKYREHGSWKYL